MASHSASFPARPDPAPRRAGRPRVRLRLHKRRLALLLVAIAFAAAGLAVAVVLLLSREQPAGLALPAPSARLLLGGPPEPQVIALRDDLRVYLPIAPAKITRIGFRASGASALPLVPVGTQENGSGLVRSIEQLLGDDPPAGLGYVLIGGGTGPQTGGLDVGAPPGTDVYSPVDGSVIAITDVVRDGQPVGHRVDLQPTGSSGVVVVVTRLAANRELSVGDSVIAARTLLGTIVDLSEVEQAALARYTQDSGQHVHIEARPAVRPA